MSREIERKWLLKPDVNINDIIALSIMKHNIKDHYYNNGTRLRIKDKNYYLTIKSPEMYNNGFLERQEIEFCIPDSLIVLFKDNNTFLQKTRYIIPYKDQYFEVNVFKNVIIDGQKLVIVELEVPNINTQITLPDWIGEEITNSNYYSAYNLFLKLQK